MEQCLGTLTGFPPRGQTPNFHGYDIKAQEHVKAVRHLAEKKATMLSQHTAELFANLDLKVHTLSYLALFEALHAYKEHSLSTLADIRVRFLEFLESFDPIQARYMGSVLVSLLEFMLEGTSYPAGVTVKVVGNVLLRLDPDGVMFTSLHTPLVKLAYRSGSLPQIQQVIAKDILLFPHMAGQPPETPLSDPSLQRIDIYSMAGFSRSITPLDLLEYNLLSGMCHAALQKWQHAFAAFERCVCHPVKDRTVSKIMLDGYRRWLMTGLVLRGKRPPLPPYADKSLAQAVNVTGRPYNTVADLFSTGDAIRLRDELDGGAATWSSDNCEAMMEVVRDAFQKWQIIRLKKIYDTVSIPDVRALTESAQTGAKLGSDEDALVLVKEIIASGRCRAELVTSPHDPAGLPWLHFISKRDVMTEQAFAENLARITASARYLQTLYRQFDEHVASSPEYVMHLARERAKLEAIVGATGGDDNDAIMEDEDLMST